MFSTETLPFIPLSLDALPYQNLRPILRIDAPTNACQSAVTARVIVARPYPAQKAQIDARSSSMHCICCQTVHNGSCYGNVAVTPNRYLFMQYTLVSKVSSGRGRNAIIRRKESQYKDIALRADHSS